MCKIDIVYEFVELIMFKNSQNYFCNECHHFMGKWTCVIVARVRLHVILAICEIESSMSYLKMVGETHSIVLHASCA